MFISLLENPKSKPSIVSAENPLSLKYERPIDFPSIELFKFF